MATSPSTVRERFLHTRHGVRPRTGWIAHVKKLSGLTLPPAHDRHGATRVDLCHPERRAAIEEAHRYVAIL